MSTKTPTQVSRTGPKPTAPAREDPIIAHEGTWTKRVEPADQGGAAYWRCEACGREIVTGADRSVLAHADGCPNGGD